MASWYGPPDVKISMPINYNFTLIKLPKIDDFKFITFPEIKRINFPTFPMLGSKIISTSLASIVEKIQERHEKKP